MTKHLEMIEVGENRGVEHPALADIIAQHSESRRQTGIDDPWQVAKRALNLLAQSRRTIQEQENQIARLRAMTETDELTGLYNRRGFTQAANRQFELAQRQDDNGVFCYIDLDGFKQINDELGHDAGDAVLRHLSMALKSFLRSTDIMGRLGGDEFAVILVNASREAGLTRAARLEDLINSLELSHNDHLIEIKASLGAVPYHGKTNLKDISRSADAQMYRKKLAKKN